MTADLSSRIKNCDADLPSGNCLAGWHWGEEREDLFNQICLSSFTLFFYQWHLRKTVDLFDQIAVHVSTCLSSVISSSENWCALDVLWWKNELCYSVVFDPLCREFKQLKASANMRSDIQHWNSIWSNFRANPILEYNLLSDIQYDFFLVFPTSIIYFSDKNKGVKSFIIYGLLFLSCSNLILALKGCLDSLRLSFRHAIPKCSNNNKLWPL